MSAPHPGFRHHTAVVDSPPEHRDWWPGMRIWRAEIDETAQLNAFVTVDAGLKVATFIGANTFLMAHTHIGHDAQIGDDCELAPGTVIGGHAILGDGVRCGINVSVLPFKKIGQGARIGAGAVVTKDVPAGEVWAGNPARRLSRAPTGIVMTEAELQGWEDFGNMYYPAGTRP